jgi:hypothetical protein
LKSDGGRVAKVRKDYGCLVEKKMFLVSFGGEMTDLVICGEIFSVWGGAFGVLFFFEVSDLDVCGEVFLVG